jgi:hypothetical protein
MKTNIIKLQNRNSNDLRNLIIKQWKELKIAYEIIKQQRNEIERLKTK